jgi:hypothetical protein
MENESNVVKQYALMCCNSKVFFLPANSNYEKLQKVFWGKEKQCKFKK